MTKKFAWPQRLPATPREILLTLQVIGLTCVLRPLVRWVKLPRLLQWLTPTRVAATPEERSLSLILRYVDSMLGRFPSNPRGSCLVRSLSLYYFGRRYGYPFHFHCGVSRSDGELKGHAWVSLNQEAFCEKGDPFSTNAVTYSYPSYKNGQSFRSRESKSELTDSRSNSAGKGDSGWPLETSVGLDIQKKS